MTGLIEGAVKNKFKVFIYAFKAESVRRVVEAEEFMRIAFLNKSLRFVRNRKKFPFLCCSFTVSIRVHISTFCTCVGRNEKSLQVLSLVK